MTRRQADALPATIQTDKGPRWIDYVPVAAVQSAESNPKGHADAVLDRSVRRFGFVEPPSLDERTGRLIAGHGRLEALKRAEVAGAPEGYDGPWPPEGVVVADDGTWQLPIVRGWGSSDDEEAKGYLIVANQSAMAGGWQERPLAEYLNAMDRQVVALEDMGFADDDYDRLLQSTGLAGELAGKFLDDVADGAPQDAEAASRGQSTDVVDLRLPMVDRERDEAMSLLRKHQRALADLNRPSASLSATALEILRTWTP